MAVVHGTATITFVEIGAKGGAFVVHVAKAYVWLLRLQVWLWVARGWLLCFRGLLGFLRRSIAKASIEHMTEARQERLRANAAKMGGVADRLFAVHDQWQEEVHPRLTNLRMAPQSSKIMHDLEAIGCSAEDIAETLALAASPEFHELVGSELEEVGVPTDHRGGDVRRVSGSGRPIH